MALSEIEEPASGIACSQGLRVALLLYSQPDHHQKSTASCSELTSGVDQLNPADRGGARFGQLCGALDYSDRQHLAFAADFDLVLRKRGKIEPGA